jgi:hypothetical protein
VIDFELEADKPNIVVVGTFAPAMFQPYWFSSFGLLQQGEAEEAQVKVIHNDVTIFETEWLRLHADQTHFRAAARQAGYEELLRDLVVGTLRLIESTPITAVGLNRELHFRAGDSDIWHAVGHHLAPKAAWAKMDSPGMLRLDIQGLRPNASSRYVNARVEPSNLVKPGVAFVTNEHFAWDSKPGPPVTATTAITAIEENWEHALVFAKDLSKSVLEEVTKNGI